MILVALIVLPVNPLEQFQHIKMKDDIAYVTNSASDSKTLLKFVQLLYLSMRWNSKALVGILEKVCPSYPFTFLGFETKVFGGNISGFWVASCKTLIQLYLWNAAQVTWLFVVLQSKLHLLPVVFDIAPATSKEFLRSLLIMPVLCYMLWPGIMLKLFAMTYPTRANGVSFFRGNLPILKVLVIWRSGFKALHPATHWIFFWSPRIQHLSDVYGSKPTRLLPTSWGS